MAQYVLTLLVKPDLDDKARKDILEAAAKKMGKVKKEDLWGMRDLSYPISRQRKAYYAHYEFEADPASISALDKALKVEEDIIRYLLVRTD